METISPDVQVTKILYFASQPRDNVMLRLGSEFDEIRKKLSKNFFEIESKQATKPDDVLETIREYKPHVVHFSAHGLETGEICLEDEQGNSKPISPNALALLFKLVSGHVKCVFINACFSVEQAQAISQYIPFVIGTKKEISDKSAIKFSTAFYSSLNHDLSQLHLTDAFNFGVAAIALENLPEHLTPIAIEGLPEVRFAAEVDTSFIAFADDKDPAFKVAVRGLMLRGLNMGLAEDFVWKIIDSKTSKMKYHRDAVNEYETNLKELIKTDFPLSDAATLALKQLQLGLQLNDEEVTAIKTRILNDPKLNSSEKWYDRGRKQDDKGSVANAIDYFSKAIEKDPDYSAAYYERGYCHDKLGEFEEAVQDFSKAIEFNNKWEILSNLTLAYYSRARAYHAIKSEDEIKQNELYKLSLADWNKTLELKPDQVEAYYGRGLVYVSLNEPQNAITDFKKAYDVSTAAEGKKRYILAIARAYLMLGNDEESNNWLDILDQLNAGETAAN